MRFENNRIMIIHTLRAAFADVALVDCAPMLLDDDDDDELPLLYSRL
jgi:hypothetical protein